MVYDQIIHDLSEATSLLPDRSNQHPGRATSGSAWTLLADVYITLEDWERAEASLNNIEGYALLDTYADIFDPSNKNHEESIFEIQYLEGTSLRLGSHFPYNFTPLTENHSELTQAPSGSQSASGSGWNIPTDDLVAAYEIGDERLDASIGFHTGPSMITDTAYVDLPYIKKYHHDHSLFGETNQNFPVYRYAEVLLMMAESVNEQGGRRSEEHTSELQSRGHLVCRLLLEKKKKQKKTKGLQTPNEYI